MPEHDKRGASGRGSAQLCVELLEDRLVLAAGSITPPPPPAPADTSATTATMTDSYSAPTPGPSQDGDGQAAPLAMSPVADGDGDSPAEYAPQTAGNPTAPSSVPVQTQAYPPTGTEARAAVQEQMMYYRPAPGQRDTDEASEYYPPATTAVSQSVAVNAARIVAVLVHAASAPEAPPPTTAPADPVPVDHADTHPQPAPAPVVHTTDASVPLASPKREQGNDLGFDNQSPDVAVPDHEESRDTRGSGSDETLTASEELPAARPFFLTQGAPLSVDLGEWEREVRHFLGQLDALTGEPAGQLWERLAPWCVVAGAMAVALELSRRRLNAPLAADTACPWSPGPEGFPWIERGR